VIHGISIRFPRSRLDRGVKPAAIARRIVTYQAGETVLSATGAWGHAVAGDGTTVRLNRRNSEYGRPSNATVLSQIL
jgi:hypothetical protein